MRGRERLLGILSADYGCAHLLAYAASDDQLCFQLPAPLTDRQFGSLRSRAAVLDAIAVGHRLSLWSARARPDVPPSAAFAISSIDSSLRTIDAVDGHHVSLSCETLTRRHDVATALRTTIVMSSGNVARTTTMAFSVFPLALATFLRRGRGFADFANVSVAAEACLSAVSEGRYRYMPAEADRLSDGQRVDHVPALVLLDLAFVVSDASRRSDPGVHVSAEFRQYADPRCAFDIVNAGPAVLEFVQGGHVAATVRIAAADQ